jgi:hypothetical protein
VNKCLLVANLLFSISVAVSAAPILSIGTPADSYLATPSGVSPRFGTLINFDGLTPNAALNPTQYFSQGVASISSPDSLTVLPYSTQSAPNEIFDKSTNGTADITVRLTSGAGTIGVGIADSDPVTITLQALNSAGSVFGTAFSINIANTGVPNNPGNGYYILTDSSADIYGFRLTQTTGNANYSGLAVDDIQFADLQSVPEPASTALLPIAGALLFAAKGLRKRA